MVVGACQKLSESRRRGVLRARVMVRLRRAVARVMARLCAGQGGACPRRLACGRPRRSGLVGYDSASYGETSTMGCGRRRRACSGAPGPLHAGPPLPCTNIPRLCKCHCINPSTQHQIQKTKTGSTMATDAILETIQPKRRMPDGDLPLSNSGGKAAAGDHLIGLRRRISSFSVRIQPLSSATTVAFRRARSMPSVKALAAAGALRRWWEWGLGWVMARKPTFARDLEMNDDEAAMLGCHSRGTWRHVFYKIRSEIRKVLGRDGLPLSAQDFRYDSVSYAQNFDSGEKEDP